MSYTLIFHPEAEKEFIESRTWYEEKSTGLGLRFERIVEKQLTIIEDNPLLFAKKRKEFRECPVPVFPFVLVYKIYPQEKKILIISIFHTSRSPSKKQKR